MPGPVPLDPLTGEPTNTPPIPTDVEIVASARPADVLRLQKEYTRKLRGLAERLQAVAAVQRKPMFGSPGAPSPTELQESLQQATALWNECNKLRPATTELARYASGLYEGSRLDRLTKIELRIRNAELEAAIENAAEAAKLPVRKTG